MSIKPVKGTYGYLDRNKIYAWIKAALMLAVPASIFVAAWIIHKTRMNAMTVVAIVGCLPGCNQVVHAIMASRYHSIERALYEQTEAARGERLAVYECVLTTYEDTYYVDCMVVCEREAVGYTSDEKTDAGKTEEHIKKMLRENSFKQNVRIFKERKAFLKRVHTLAMESPKKVPFKEDDRYPGLNRDEIIRYLLMAISL